MCYHWLSTSQEAVGPEADWATAWGPSTVPLNEFGATRAAAVHGVVSKVCVCLNMCLLVKRCLHPPLSAATTKTAAAAGAGGIHRHTHTHTRSERNTQTFAVKAGRTGGELQHEIHSFSAVVDFLDRKVGNHGPPKQSALSFIPDRLSPS